MVTIFLFCYSTISLLGVSILDKHKFPYIESITFFSFPSQFSRYINSAHACNCTFLLNITVFFVRNIIINNIYLIDL